MYFRACVYSCNVSWGWLLSKFTSSKVMLSALKYYGKPNTNLISKWYISNYNYSSICTNYVCAQLKNTYHMTMLSLLQKTAKLAYCWGPNSKIYSLRLNIYLHTFAVISWNKTKASNTKWFANLSLKKLSMKISFNYKVWRDL